MAVLEEYQEDGVQWKSVNKCDETGTNGYVAHGDSSVMFDDENVSIGSTSPCGNISHQTTLEDNQFIDAYVTLTYFVTLACYWAVTQSIPKGQERSSHEAQMDLNFKDSVTRGLKRKHERDETKEDLTKYMKCIPEDSKNDEKYKIPKPKSKKRKRRKKNMPERNNTLVTNYRDQFTTWMMNLFIEGLCCSQRLIGSCIIRMEIFVGKHHKICVLVLLMTYFCSLTAAPLTHLNSQRNVGFSKSSNYHDYKTHPMVNTYSTKTAKKDYIVEIHQGSSNSNDILKEITMVKPIPLNPDKHEVINKISAKVEKKEFDVKLVGKNSVMITVRSYKNNSDIRKWTSMKKVVTFADKVNLDYKTKVRLGMNYSLIIYNLTFDEWNNPWTFHQGFTTVKITSLMEFVGSLCPENFTVFDSSPKSITVSWDSGLNRGHLLTTYIQYQEEVTNIWINSTVLNSEQFNDIQQFKIVGLKMGTKYKLRLFTVIDRLKNGTEVVLFEKTKYEAKFQTEVVYIPVLVMAAVSCLIFILWKKRNNLGTLVDGILHKGGMVHFSPVDHGKELKEDISETVGQHV